MSKQKGGAISKARSLVFHSTFSDEKPFHKTLFLVFVFPLPIIAEKVFLKSICDIENAILL